MLLRLTERQKLVMRAALSYAFSNLDDVNEAMDNGDGGITAGTLSGPEITEAEVNAMLAVFDKTPPASDDGEPLTLRAFRGNFLVAIDDSEADDYDDVFDEVEDDEDEPSPATLDAVKEYLKDAAAVDMDMEEYGNPVGFQSLELQFESLEELPPDEVRRLYKK